MMKKNNKWISNYDTQDKIIWAYNDYAVYFMENIQVSILKTPLKFV